MSGEYFNVHSASHDELKKIVAMLLEKLNLYVEIDKTPDYTEFEIKDYYP